LPRRQPSRILLRDPSGHDSDSITASSTISCLPPTADVPVFLQQPVRGITTEAVKR
jgi:hypothetical protein